MTRTSSRSTTASARCSSAQCLSRGHRRSRLLLRLRHVGEIDRQHRQRRRRQRAELYALSQAPSRRARARRRIGPNGERHMTEQLIAADSSRATTRARGRPRARLRHARRAARPPRHRHRCASTTRSRAFGVAVPSWGVGTGGTRFARFPGPGEPRDIFDKLEDCAVIQQLTRATPTVSLHIPWDKADPNRLKQAASRFGLGFDAMNSNTFSGRRGPAALLQVRLAQPHRRGGTRQQAVEHNLECIEIGQTLGSQGADRLDRRRLELPRPVPTSPAPSSAISTRCARSMTALPEDWRLFTEHKMYEPAFYSTVVQDWGTNYLIATGARAQGLLPRRSRPPCAERQHRDDRRAADPVRQARRLPLQRFEIWRRRPRRRLDRPVPAVPGLQRAGRCRVPGAEGFDPAHMLDQSHNVTDPIESLMQRDRVQRAYGRRCWSTARRSGLPGR